MPSQNKNIIANLRGKHDPHYKLAARVDALEKDVRGISSIHVTLSKSFGMQRKTLIRVLALEKKVADLKSEVEAEEDIGDWADESGEWGASGGASSTAEEGGATTTQTSTATATKDRGYASRVEGKDASGEYLSPSARKLAFKRKKISASAFKKGSSVGGAEKVAADTTGASAIQKWKPPAEGGDLAKADDVTPKESGSDLIGPLKTLNNSVNGIIETLKASNKADGKAQNAARKAAEKDKRKGAESKLESIGGKLKTVASNVLTPVQSIWAKILGFISTVFLGNIAMRLWGWFGDPKNTEKISSIFKFIKDWWPLLLAAVMKFFPILLGPGGFILGVIALLAWGIPKILDAIKWVKNLFGIGGDKEIKDITKESKTLGKDLEGDIEGDLQKDGDKILKEGTSDDPETQQEPKELETVQSTGEESTQSLQKTEDLPAANKFNKGGVVPGSGNRDTVPAMLTPGEFVMSKGAVQEYGQNTLAGMNAAAGGTNKPTVSRGYQGGGSVKNVSQYSQGSSVKNISQYNQGGLVKNMSSDNFSLGGPNIHYSGGGVVNSIAGSLNVPQKIIPIPRLNFAGGGAVPTAESIQIDYSTSSLTPIKPPSTPQTKVVFDKGAAQEQKAASAKESVQDLPQFNPSAMRSSSKIKTLGISV